MVDTISQLIIGLKNANSAGKASVSFPYSKMREAILETLHKEGFVGPVSKKGKKVIKTIEVNLEYVDGRPRIEAVQQISKNSRRMYAGVAGVNSVRNGFGALIVSTPNGIMVDKDARKAKVGGELLFKIW